MRYIFKEYDIHRKLFLASEIVATEEEGERVNARLQAEGSRIRFIKMRPRSEDTRLEDGHYSAVWSSPR